MINNLDELKTYCDTITVPLLRAETLLVPWKETNSQLFSLAIAISNDYITSFSDYKLFIAGGYNITMRIKIDIFSNKFKWFVDSHEREYEFGTDDFEKDFLTVITNGVQQWHRK